MEKKRKDLAKKQSQKFVEEFISLISEISEASENEIPIYKMRINKTVLQCRFNCSITFSGNGKYYSAQPSEPYLPYTSEQVLKCCDDEIRDVPNTISMMKHFDSTSFPDNILNDVFLELKSKHYTTKRISKGIEITLRKNPEIEQKQKAVEELILLISKVYEASKNEIPIYKMRINKPVCPGLFGCLIAFSDDGKYYDEVPSDPYLPYTSKHILSCGDKEIWNAPNTIGMLQYFRNTYFPDNILNDVFLKLKSKHYTVKKIKDGFEIIF